MNLKNELAERFSELGIRETVIQSINFYLSLLNEHDTATYEHSCRVGLLASRIADYEGLELKPSLYAGLLHDIGKIFVDNTILRKLEITSEEYETIKKHVIHSYEMLCEDYPFSAEIVVRHHQFSEEPYPKELPTGRFSKEANEVIEKHARIVSIADFFDALTTRAPKYAVDLNDPRAIKHLMISQNPTQKELIERLYNAEIL